MKFSEQRCPNCKQVDYKVIHKYKEPTIDGEMYWHAACNRCGHNYSIIAEVLTNPPTHETVTKNEPNQQSTGQESNAGISSSQPCS